MGRAGDKPVGVTSIKIIVKAMGTVKIAQGEAGEGGRCQNSEEHQRFKRTGEKSRNQLPSLKRSITSNTDSWKPREDDVSRSRELNKINV